MVIVVVVVFIVCHTVVVVVFTVCHTGYPIAKILNEHTSTLPTFGGVQHVMVTLFEISNLICYV